MEMNIGNILKAIMLSTTCLLQGCAIGFTKYAGPDIPPKAEVAVLQSVPIYFRNCAIKRRQRIDIDSKINGTSLSDFLLSEYGLAVMQGEPKIGERAVYVQVSYSGFDEPLWGVASAVIHFLSFSIFPGYYSVKENYTFQVMFAKPDGSAAQQRFEASIKRQQYLWFPLIFKMDLVGSINGGLDHSADPEKKIQAQRGLVGEIAKEIQKQINAAGGIAGWQQTNVPQDGYCDDGQ